MVLAREIAGGVIAAAAIMLLVMLVKEPSSACFKIGDALVLFGAC